MTEMKGDTAEKMKVQNYLMKEVVAEYINADQGDECCERISVWSERLNK